MTCKITQIFIPIVGVKLIPNRMVYVRQLHCKTEEENYESRLNAA